ncbi:MAG: hypothetical protein Q8R29_00115 [bacterium]|nr:hypothetical protein [bacterium]
MAARKTKKRKNKKQSYINISAYRYIFKILGRDYKCWLVVIGWSVFVLLLTGYFYISSLKEYLSVSKSLSSPITSMNESVKGWVEIDYSNGKKRIFVADFYQEFSLATVLESSFGSGKLKLVIKNGGIESIGGVKGHWVIYRNKKLVGPKLNGLTIKGGDNYTIKKN